MQMRFDRSAPEAQVLGSATGPLAIGMATSR